MRIFKTKWFTRFARKNEITDRRLKVAIGEIEKGILDADLGGGLVKKRVARAGAGKSGGYRTMIAYRRGERAFFLFGFPKNELDNVSNEDLARLREIGSELVNMTEQEIANALRQGRVTEISDAEKI